MTHDVHHRSSAKGNSGGIDYRVVFNATRNAMVLAVLDSGQIVAVNEAWVRDLSLTREQAVGQTMLGLGLWADRAECDKALLELKSHGWVKESEANLIVGGKAQSYGIAAQVLEIDGERVALWEFWDLSGQRRLHEKSLENQRKVDELLAVSEQSRRALLGILEDEKRSREALRASESRLKSINDNFVDGMIYQIRITPDGQRQFTYISDSVRHLHGISPEEAMADASLIYNRIHPDDVEAFRQAEEKSIREFKPFRAETRVASREGGYRWSTYVSSPRRLEDGSTLWDGIEFDITERKQAEEALRESEERYRSFVSHSSEGIYRLEMITHVSVHLPREELVKAVS